MVSAGDDKVTNRAWHTDASAQFSEIFVSRCGSATALTNMLSRDPGKSGDADAISY
jgi:hypothetical protein